MSPIDRLSALFEKFPGIGPRQARRFVQYLLVAPPGIRGEIAEQIRSLGTQTAQCKRCYRWFPVRQTTSNGASTCDICMDEHREKSLLFVVEKDADIDNVERSGYKGLYFVLGGIIPLASEEPEKHVRLRELLRRAEADKPAEIILGRISPVWILWPLGLTILFLFLSSKFWQFSLRRYQSVSS